MGPKSAQMLKLIPDSKVNVIDRCSGHGGSWGVKKGNFDSAIKVGKIPTKNAMKCDSKYFASTCPLAGEHMKQISDLEQTKINLMMIKRENNLDYTKQKLEDAYTDELRDEFKKDK